jgi:hypothetical protein
MIQKTSQALQSPLIFLIKSDSITKVTQMSVSFLKLSVNTKMSVKILWKAIKN